MVGNIMSFGIPTYQPCFPGYGSNMLNGVGYGSNGSCNNNLGNLNYMP